MEEALDAGAEIDEGAEVADRYHAAGHDRAGHDRRAELGGVLLLFFLEHLPPRHDQVAAALLVLDDAERVDAADVRSGSAVARDVDLRDRAERALARHAVPRSRP